MNELLALGRAYPALASLLLTAFVGYLFWFLASRKSQKAPRPFVHRAMPETPTNQECYRRDA